jgi:hypothetical protein
MNLGLIISSIALGISLTASAIKLVDWLIGADPRVVIRMGRSLLFVLAVGSLPCLIILLIYQQWTIAIALGAGMLIVPTLFNWRAILPRPTLRPIWTEDDPLDGLRGDFGQPPPGPELAHRAAIVLEDYLMYVGHPAASARIGRQRPVTQETPPSRQDRAMSAEEALEILGLEPGTAPAAIQAAHRRLLLLVHPDRGGTNFLAAQINRAKETLQAEAALEPHASMRHGANAAATQAAAKDE